MKKSKFNQLKIVPLMPMLNIMGSVAIFNNSTFKEFIQSVKIVLPSEFVLVTFIQRFVRLYEEIIHVL